MLLALTNWYLGQQQVPGASSSMLTGGEWEFQAQCKDMMSPNSSAEHFNPTLPN